MSTAARWGLGILALTLLSLFSVVKEQSRWAGDPRFTFFWRALVHDLILWYSWVLLTPLVFAAAKRFPVEPRRLHNVAIHVPIAFAVIFAAAVLRTLGRELVLRNQDDILRSVMIAFRSSTTLFLILYTATVALFYAAEYYAQYQRRATREAQLETALARAQLDMLRRQLQPHFLFNTLHAISALMGRDVVAARRMVSRLSDLLREALDEEAPHETTLEEELRLLDGYIDIQRIRFAERLQVSIDVEPAARSMLVPRLILQPLVENAIQHGVGRSARGGRVVVSARSVAGRLTIAVEDDGPGAPDGVVSPGVGLGNTRARLAQLFGDDHAFIIDGAGPGFRVSFSIPARVGAEALTA